jgi:hypothetical protein
VDSDSLTRSRQLYSMLQPYAARLQALLERLDHENFFKATATEVEQELGAPKAESVSQRGGGPPKRSKVIVSE